MTRRGGLQGLRIPYVCPFPDSNEPAPRGKHGSAIVRVQYRGRYRLLTQYLSLRQGNLVLFEMWLP